MMHYLSSSQNIKREERIFVKSFGSFSFSKNMYKNIAKSISKILIRKYSQKIVDHAKQSATDVLKTASKRVIQ